MIVVCGATGSGKTTQLPQMVLAAWQQIGLAANLIIGHTQPRRLAARSVATRIAEEMGQRIDTAGCLVGSKVRFADTTSRSTRIKLMTDGILLAEVQTDPLLSRYGCIIIDEAHERTLNIDFLLGYLKRLLPKRPDLKVIVTSATIDPARFVNLFAAQGRPVALIEVSGRAFPIEIRYAPVEPGRSGIVDDGDIDDAIVDAVRALQRPGTLADGTPLDVGDVLVFLPGEKEIRSAASALQRSSQTSQGTLEVLPLYAKLTAAAQDRIFKPAAGARRVILATNIAETSLTVPGIRHVVDVGVARINRYDYRTKITRLQVEPVSQASANQRSGRCGRIAPGLCIRLYPEADFVARPIFTDPEIRRISLASAILRCLSLGLGPIEEFPFLDAPEPKAIAEARATLFELAAVTSESADAPLTPIGDRLARLPLDPRPARILLQAADEGCLHEALILVAALSSQDPRERPGATGGVQQAAHLAFSHPDSDYLTLLNYWQALQMRTRGHGASDDDGNSGYGNNDSQSLFAFCREACLSYNRTREWLNTYHQLADLCAELGLAQNTVPAEAEKIHRAIMAGTLSGVLCRDDLNSQGHNTIYRGIRGLFASIHPGSALFKRNPKWLLSGEIVQTTKIYARSCCTIKPEWIIELGAHLIERTCTDEHFDPALGEVMAYAKENFAGVALRPRTAIALHTVDPARARAMFIAEGVAQGRYVWPESVSAQPGPHFLAANQAAFASARTIHAKLRQHDVLLPPAARTSMLERALPTQIVGHASLAAVFAAAAGERVDEWNAALTLSAQDLLTPAALAVCADPAVYPDELLLTSPAAGKLLCPLRYAFTPGKDGDGLTLHLPLLALAELPSHRPDWLVPGMLAERIESTFKQLPRSGGLDAIAAFAKATHTDLAGLARSVADVLDFASGPLHLALAEALATLTAINIEPERLICRNLPEHLQMRIIVHEEAQSATGPQLAAGKDLAALLTKLTPRLIRAKATLAQQRFAQQNITDWSFGPLPLPGEPIEDAASPAAASDAARFATLLDAGSSVTLTLLDSAPEAEAQTRKGVRRLFALALAGEMQHHLAAIGNFDELARLYKPFGNRDELADVITCLVAEAIFMHNQSPVRDAETFEQRKATHWGRVATSVRETAGMLTVMLDARAKIAHRLGAGTNRNWVASINDLREHLAYLMPPRFLMAITPDRLASYVRYTQAARQRLLNLREDGSGSEAATLAMLGDRFKRFTGAVAKLHADLLRAEQAAPAATGACPAPSASPSAKGAVIAASRRHTTRINADAAAWAIEPGSLPAPLERYRWLLEDLRLVTFAPELAPDLVRRKLTPADADKAWQAVVAKA